MTDHDELERAVERLGAWERLIESAPKDGETFEVDEDVAFDLASDLRLILSANREMRERLARLASSEAFDTPQAIDGPLAEELRMRLDYARSALSPNTQARGGEG